MNKQQQNHTHRTMVSNNSISTSLPLSRTCTCN